jgi:hypothetical protein
MVREVRPALRIVSDEDSTKDTPHEYPEIPRDIRAMNDSQTRVSGFSKKAADQEFHEWAMGDLNPRPLPCERRLTRSSDLHRCTNAQVSIDFEPSVVVSVSGCFSPSCGTDAGASMSIAGASVAGYLVAQLISRRFYARMGIHPAGHFLRNCRRRPRNGLVSIGRGASSHQSRRGLSEGPGIHPHPCRRSGSDGRVRHLLDFDLAGTGRGHDPSLLRRRSSPVGARNWLQSSWRGYSLAQSSAW